MNTFSTENVAIALLVVAVLGLWRLCMYFINNSEKYRQQSIQSFRDGIELQMARTAEITSISGVLSALERRAEAQERMLQALVEEVKRYRDEVEAYRSGNISESGPVDDAAD